jgi:hypothetical protein
MHVWVKKDKLKISSSSSPKVDGVKKIKSESSSSPEKKARSESAKGETVKKNKPNDIVSAKVKQEKIKKEDSSGKDKTTTDDSDDDDTPLVCCQTFVFNSLFAIIGNYNFTLILYFFFL